MPVPYQNHPYRRISVRYSESGNLVLGDCKVIECRHCCLATRALCKLILSYLTSELMPLADPEIRAAPLAA